MRLRIFSLVTLELADFRKLCWKSHGYLLVQSLGARTSTREPDVGALALGYLRGYSPVTLLPKARCGTPAHSLGHVTYTTHVVEVQTFSHVSVEISKRRTGFFRELHWNTIFSQVT
jgi:hypothetical protein